MFLEGRIVTMNFKQLLAIGVILTLIGIIIYGVVADNNDDDEFNGMMTVYPDDVDPDSLGVDVGDVAKDFQLRDLDNNLVKLSDFQGKKVFLNFWASWCAPCKEEMPDMQRLYEEYSDEVEVIAVNVTGSEVKRSNVDEFVDEYDFTYTILLDDNNSVSNEYLASQLPTSYFINSEGIVQLPRHTGPLTFEDMEEIIQQLD